MRDELIPAIELSHISKSYGTFKAVDNINLTVKTGEIFGFIGPNGAGKTTTIKSIVGASTPTSGTAKINGIDIFKQPTLAQQWLGYIPETTNALYLDMTANEFVTYSARLKGLNKSLATTNAESMLKVVGMQDFSTRRIGKMSTGMKQRVNMAQALVSNPDIIVADEPTLGLDPVGKKNLLDLFKQLKDLGKTIFISSHILDELEKIVERVAVINKGTISYEGTFDEMVTTFRPDVYFIQTSDLEMLQYLLDISNIEIINVSRTGYTIKVRSSTQLSLLLEDVTDKTDLLELRAVQTPLERLFFDNVGEKDSQESFNLEELKVFVE
ncbi:MAG: ABC transporter ATP-binding protein [Candidatus Heimdallarchaeota archaeon]|nr:ABC transporter ATP-binding protein [Candidatus Heimdallarchaeota archaeon]